MYSDGIDFKSLTTQELLKGLKTYKGCIESSLSFGDYDDVMDMIQKIKDELERRGETGYTLQRDVADSNG
jgi:hypothetical protein